MLLTKKLASYLHRVFSKDPEPFLAIRLRYDGSMSWKVADGFLTTEIEGGSGAALNVDLSAYTIASLVTYLSAQTGYSVAFSVSGQQSVLSAQVLLDGGNNQDVSNGDHLYGYASLLWAYLEANAMELQEAKKNISEMLLQMSVSTAGNEWLDELGDYYDCPRLVGENDTIYARRIIASIIRPKGNNIVIEMAIKSAANGFAASVLDTASVEPAALMLRKGEFRYNSEYTRTPSKKQFYGLFDVTAVFDLLSAESYSALLVRIRAAVDENRDMGTKMRQLTVAGVISDTAGPSSDAISVLSIGLSALSDHSAYLHDGLLARNGSVYYANAETPVSINSLLQMSDAWSGESDVTGFLAHRDVYHNSKFQRAGQFAYSGDYPAEVL